jgi:hypothetical protein
LFAFGNKVSYSRHAAYLTGDRRLIIACCNFPDVAL